MNEDLISRSELLKQMEEFCGNQRYLISEEIWSMVKSISSANSPQKPIKVKPIRVSNDRTDGCPICKREFYEKFNFCPDCGTKMDWGDDE